MTDKTLIGFRAPKDVKARLEDLAHERRQTVSQVLMALVQAELDKQL